MLVFEVTQTDINVISYELELGRRQQRRRQQHIAGGNTAYNTQPMLQSNQPENIACKDYSKIVHSYLFYRSKF